MSLSGLKLPTQTEAEARAAGHSRLPWSASNGHLVRVHSLGDPEHPKICGVHKLGKAENGERAARRLAEANAAFIVLAANGHDPMRTSLAGIVAGLRDMRRRGVINEADDGQWLDEVLSQADRAIAIARGAKS